MFWCRAWTTHGRWYQDTAAGGGDGGYAPTCGDTSSIRWSFGFYQHQVVVVGLYCQQVAARTTGW
jgi:hypothetical protein